MHLQNALSRLTPSFLPSPPRDPKVYFLAQYGLDKYRFPLPHTQRLPLSWWLVRIQDSGSQRLTLQVFTGFSFAPLEPRHFSQFFFCCFFIRVENLARNDAVVKGFMSP